MSDDALNSTLYYEIQKVSELQNLVEICVLAMLGTVGLCFGFMGIYVVETNPYLKDLGPGPAPLKALGLAVGLAA
ncbi:unnamed protein product, partial [Mesorhabditis belari]|uniref:Uncharacterized protein n=1 Tax=Mesorhabditis belari TaxID=2138241 RepID=A0AAF3ELY3_9BILA